MMSFDVGWKLFWCLVKKILWNLSVLNSVICWHIQSHMLLVGPSLSVRSLSIMLYPLYFLSNCLYFCPCVNCLVLWSLWYELSCVVSGPCVMNYLFIVLLVLCAACAVIWTFCCTPSVMNCLSCVPCDMNCPCCAVYVINCPLIVISE